MINVKQEIFFLRYQSLAWNLLLILGAFVEKANFTPVGLHHLAGDESAEKHCSLSISLSVSLSVLSLSLSSLFAPRCVC